MVVQRVDLVDADLQAAVRMLMAQTGVEIVIEASDKPYGRINLMLEKRPLDTVLQMICRAAGASVRTEGGVYVIGAKDKAPAVETPKSAEQPATPAVPQAPKRYRTERIAVQRSRPSEIVNFLTHADISGRGDFLRSMMFETLGDRKIGYGADINAGGTGRGPGPLVNDAQPPSVVPTGPAASGNDREANQFGGGMRGGGGGMRGGGGGYGGYGGGGGGQFGGGGYGGGGQFGGGRGGFGGGGQLGGGGGQLGGGGGQFGGGGGGNSLVPENIESMLAYDIDNTIIVRTSDEDALRELKEIIRLLDIAPKQLMIKAEFVEVSQDDVRQFGIDWQLARGNLVAGNPGFAAGQVFMNYATGNVAAQLRATLTEGKGRLVSSPMVTTLNNLPVSLAIGREIPVFITSPTAGGNGVVVLQTDLQTVQAQSGMDVLARINGDDTITLTIAPFVSDISGQVTGPEGTTAPIISYQTIGPITRRVRNGDSIAIAGLVRKNDGTSIKKVPLFGDLPLIGQLFQSREYRVSDSELLVFVTPSILPDPSGAAGTVTVGGAPTP
jgi:general secretion pathway protein D